MGVGRPTGLGLKINLGEGLCDSQTLLVSELWASKVGTQIQYPEFEAPPQGQGGWGTPKVGFILKPTLGSIIIPNCRSLSVVVWEL